eukprot:TRINITY_DN8441_c1_g2_i1.p1 TRINITY_DN8441_c1_g2~~TRINITY_DN8441_c1_g2_i1.p1  ORF type:complete len:535 (-),score=48.47 TRINITY_DN8441_c1_g2_i1:326-1930(-)
MVKSQHSQTEKSTQESDEFLEELFRGDVGFDEMVPVDTFFDNYVDQLLELDPQTLNQPNPPQFDFSQPQQMFQGVIAGSNYEMASAQQQFQQYQLPQRTTAMTLSPMHAGYMQYGVQHQQQVGQTGSFTKGILDDLSIHTQQQQQVVHGNIDETMEAEFIASQGHSGHSQQDQDSQDKKSGDSKPIRVRNRSPKQQAMNKQAQQRYRERKKNKALNMERTVVALTQEVQSLRALRDQKVQLEDRASELEHQLIEREAELNRLKAEIHNYSKGNGSFSGAEGDAASLARAGTDLSDIQQEAEHLAMQFHAQVNLLRDVAKQLGIENISSTDIYGQNLDSMVLQGLEQLVRDICMVCMRLLRLEGADVWSLIKANVKVAPSSDRCWNVTSTAKRLNFTGDQQQRILALRKEYLRKLDDIFNQRQGLNLKAISVLLPVDQGGQGPNPYKAGATSSLTGFFSRAKHNGRLNQVLERLKENLRSEQRAASELDYIVFHRLLTPIQAAWFVLECYPEHCDCLELLNGCERAFNQNILPNQ